jgi:hypothetical protein
MTRGKYAARAALRREDTEVRTELEARHGPAVAAGTEVTAHPAWAAGLSRGRR